MTDTQTLWRDALAESLSTDVSEDLDAYASQLELKRSGTLDDRVFAEIRLRRGIYGQRYDNGQRHDGLRSRTLAYPTSATKGPGTLWDAPGMLRIKVPFGALNAGLNLPRLVAVHLNPGHQEQLLGELSDLAAELGVDLVPAHDGMVVTP